MTSVSGTGIAETKKMICDRSKKRELAIKSMVYTEVERAHKSVDRSAKRGAMPSSDLLDLLYMSLSLQFPS